MTIQEDGFCAENLHEEETLRLTQTALSLTYP